LCAGYAVAGPRAHAAAAHAHAILVSFTRFRSLGCARAAGALELRPPRLLPLHPELFCAPLDGLSRLQDDEKERDTTENLLERADVEALMEALSAPGAPAPRPPVWLHGDLWAGNVLMSERGRCWLIDPAVYAGDPRIDLAMSRRFGGFSPAFYELWHQVHGRRADDGFFEQVYVIWPLLVHAALFGGRYGRAAAEAARRALASWPA